MLSLLDRLMDEVSFPKLSKLGLWWFAVRYHKLVSFLKRHRSTLVRVNIGQSNTIESRSVDWPELLAQEGLELHYEGSLEY